MASVFDDPRNKKVDALMFHAERADRARRKHEAVQLWMQAATLEYAIASGVPASKPRVRRLLAESAAALHVRAAKAIRREFGLPEDP